MHELYSRLGADLEVNVAGGSLAVVGGTGGSLDVAVDAVVVASAVGAQVAETVEGNGVLGGVEAGSKVVAGDLAVTDVVRRLGTGEEAVTAKNGVSGEGGALREKGKNGSGSSSENGNATKIALLTLKRSRCWRVWRPGCL